MSMRGWIAGAAVLFAAGAGLAASQRLQPDSGHASLPPADIWAERAAQAQMAENLFADAQANSDSGDYASASRAALLGRNYKLASEIGRAWAADGGGLPALRVAASAELRFGPPGAAEDLLAQIGSRYGPAETYRTIVLSSPAHNLNPSLGRERVRLMRTAHPEHLRDARFHSHLALLMFQGNLSGAGKRELAHALELDPGDYGSLFLAAVQQLQGQERDAAAAQRLLAASPPDEPASASLLRLLRWQVANRTRYMPLPQRAADVADDIPVAAPQLLEIARTLNRLGLNEQALAMAAQVGFRGRQGTVAGAFRLQARLLRILGRNAELERVAAAALAAVDDASIDAVARRGTDELARAGAVDAAYRIASASDRERPALVLLELAGRYGHASGRTAEAAAILEDALAVRPGHAGLLRTAGFFFADSGYDLDRARILLEQAAELKPRGAQTLDALGWLAFREGDLEQAASLLQQALATQPNADVAARLAEVLWAQGKEAAAVDLLRQATRRSSSSFVVRQAAERLGVADRLRAGGGASRAEAG